MCPAAAPSGQVRPDIVWFGEMPYEMERIDEALRRCDLFVSIGTSGAVYPAAGFVQTARYCGARTLEINLEPSLGSYLFDESRIGPAGELVPAWVEEVLARLVSPLQPDLAVERAVLVPFRIDLHVQEQVHRAAEMLRDLGSRAAAPIAFSRAPALADDDRLLAVALDQDLLVDDGRAVGAVLPGLGLDRRRIGQLLVELVDDLLAGQLGRDHAVGRVGDFVLGIEPRALAASPRRAPA